MAQFMEYIGFLIAIFILLYYYLTATFNFWKTRNVPGPKPIPLFGNIKDVVFSKIGMGEYIKNLYEKYKGEPIFGIFVTRTPVVVLRDPDLIKDVLIKDFSNFAERGVFFHEKTDPLSAHLFALDVKRWRPLRSRLSPVFTSGKLKDMFGMIVECSEHLDKLIDKVATKGDPVEVRELTAKFTTDVIGTCAFGIDAKAMQAEDSEFRRMGRKIFKSTGLSSIRFRLRQFAPDAAKILCFFIRETEISEFFTTMTMETLKYRDENKIHRNDFMNTLLELKKHPEKMPDVELTDTLTTAQAFVFFAAGFETSSTTMSHALYELALNQDIQDRLRTEIEETYEESNGNLEYETIKKMSYLDAVFRETLRKYPPVQILMRKAAKSYTFTGTRVTIPAGQQIWIPAYAIHSDPSIYPEPKKFDPERFLDGSAATRHQMHFLPFGEGPRNCIGARFAVYQTKIGLITFLRNYRVDVCDKTTEYVINPKAFLLTPIGGLYLKITKLEKS